jgi:transcriptional regulator with XRE-family HTH domain
VEGPPQELRNEDLGARVRAVRELSGLHQRDVAQAAGMSRRDLQAAERGAKRLSVPELRAIAGALEVDPDVLVGVGYEGDLLRAPVEARTNEFIDHDPERGGARRETVDDPPPTTPMHAPNPERRKDFATRSQIEQSWRDVRSEMGETLTSCARLISAGSGDDLRRLVQRLERDLQALTASPGFQTLLAAHERALHRARRSQPAPTPDVRVSASH